VKFGLPACSKCCNGVHTPSSFGAALLDNFRHIADKGDQAAIKRMALLAAQAAKAEKEQKPWDGIDRRKGNG
jgi:hypothetical protein